MEACVAMFEVLILHGQSDIIYIIAHAYMNAQRWIVGR
jgi:hypothetical protein